MNKVIYLVQDRLSDEWVDDPWGFSTLERAREERKDKRFHKPATSRIVKRTFVDEVVEE